MKEVRILAIGDNVCDKYLSRGKMYPGGQCVNTCVYAGMNGVPAAYLGQFGDDEPAKLMQEVLKEKGIDTVLRYTDEGRIYGATFIDHRTECVLNGSRMGKELSANALQEHFTLPYAGQPPIPLSIPMDAADKAHGQTAYDREDVSGGIGLLTPEGPAVDAEEEVFIRAMKRKKKKKRKGLGL